MKLQHLFNIDCLAHMRQVPDKHYDVAIVDPPTGQNEGNRHKTRPGTIKQANGSRIRIKKPHKTKSWDQAPFDQNFYDELFRVSKHQIIMCENRLNFHQKEESSGRIVWNLLRQNDFSSCQIMWTDLINKIDYFEFLWNGMQQGSNLNSRVQKGDKSKNEKRIHPSQKPVAVYRYLLKKYCDPNWTVFDPTAGSASSAIACFEENFTYTGIEKDVDYFTDGLSRYRQHIAQVRAPFLSQSASSQMVQV